MNELEDIGKFISEGLESYKYEDFVDLMFGGETYTLTKEDVKEVVDWVYEGILNHYEIEGLIFNIKDGSLSIDDFDGGYVIINLNEFMEWITYE